MKPLIFIPSPRDLPEFIEAAAKIKYDKLWLKYYNEDDAYRLGRYWFSEHPEYTHFVILPDDLIVKNEDIEQLMEDAAHYDVVSGWCRNTIRLKSTWQGPPETEDNADSCISIESLPPNPPKSGTYEQFHFLSLKNIKNMKSIVPVKFSCFALIFIPRKIIYQIPFRTSDGCCVDSCFSLDLWNNNIRQYCDLAVRTVHISNTYSKIKVGKEAPSLRLEVSSM